MKNVKTKQLKIIFIILYFLMCSLFGLSVIKYVFNIKFQEPIKVYYEPEDKD